MSLLVSTRIGPGLALLLVVSFLSAQQKPEDLQTFKVDVRLVNVLVTVTDENGAPISHLHRDNFQIREDGKPEKISVFQRESGLPLSIVLAVDTSLSTRKDLPYELAVAHKFIHAILRPVDMLSLYQFYEDVDEVLPFTSDLKKIDRGLTRFRVGGGTALYDAIYLGTRALLDRQGRKVMVLITDGGDTVSRSDYHSAIRAAQEAEAILYPIIVVPIEASAGRNTGGEHALIQASRDTGGKYYYAGNSAELEKAFGQISEELRTQYLLGYYPSRRLSDSEFRRIEVEVIPPLSSDPAQAGDGEKKYVVRHRSGYYTSKPR